MYALTAHDRVKNAQNDFQQRDADGRLKLTVRFQMKRSQERAERMTWEAKTERERAAVLERQVNDLQQENRALTFQIEEVCGLQDITDARLRVRPSHTPAPPPPPPPHTHTHTHTHTHGLDPPLHSLKIPALRHANASIPLTWQQ